MEKRGNPRRWVAGLMILLALAYVVSPYLSFWRFSDAIKSGNRERLEAHVDFNSVRKSIKEQLRAKLTTTSASAGAPQPKQDLFAGLVQRLAPSLIDQLVDSFVTPEGLAALIAEPELAKSPGLDSASSARRAGRADQAVDWSRIDYAFFTGPKEFLVDVEGVKLRFHFTGLRWQLKQVELP